MNAIRCRNGRRQTRHSRSDYPDVFFYGFMPVVVYNRKRGLVNLEVICGQYFLPEFQIKWPEKLSDRSEPAVQCVFGQFHTQMFQLFHLSVERDMIFVFL